MNPETTTTLYIDPSRSECGACGKNADPNEESHVMERMVGEGCGARYVNLSSHYPDFEGLYAAVQAKRPDLPFAGLFWSPTGEDQK